MMQSDTMLNKWMSLDTKPTPDSFVSGAVRIAEQLGLALSWNRPHEPLCEPILALGRLLQVDLPRIILAGTI